MDLVTILQRDRLTDAGAIHHCSVLASEILDRGLLWRDDDAGVTTGDGVRVDANGAIAIATDEGGALSKDPLAALRDEARP